MRNEAVATGEDKRVALNYGVAVLAGAAAAESSSFEASASTASHESATSVEDFPADFTAEEKFFMIEIAALLPSEREFVALLGGDVAEVWDADLGDDGAGQHPSLEQRTISSVFERLNLPAPLAHPRKP